MINNQCLTRLQKLQNECISILTHDKYSADMYMRFAILKVKELLKLENCKMMYKSKLNLLPVKVTTAIQTDHQGKSLKKNTYLQY